jgi:hypothetical protein
MQKWLNDLYTQILKNGFNPGGGGGGGGGSHSGGGQGVLVGKYLGDTYTDAQKQAIANGTFEGLNIGDYWTINNINWRIADFDYYYNVGDENKAFTKHHVIIIPDTILYDWQMNGSASVSGCYTGSGLYRNISQAISAFVSAFGDSFIATHRGLYANTFTDGVPSNYAWVNMRVELMSEEQLYGHSVWGSCNQNGYDVGTQKTQFRLFALDQTKINIRHKYWLTNVKSTTQFAGIDENGSPSFAKTSDTMGFRPFACLVGD